MYFSTRQLLQKSIKIAKQTTSRLNFLRDSFSSSSPSSSSSFHTSTRRCLPHKSEDKTIWDKTDLSQIFKNNEDWVKKMTKDSPTFFKDLDANPQTPKYLLIGCSDSRVGAQEIMGLNQGELFVHRNIANLVVNTDLNVLSVLYYAVNVLKVEDIFVLGHYNCGGVRAASDNKDLGLIDHWLKQIRDVSRTHHGELQSIEDDEERHRRLVELNVQEQCINLFGNSIVQNAQATTSRPRIHGMVYDIKDGKLKKLDINFKEVLKKYRNIYTVAEFKRHTPVDVKEFLENEESGMDPMSEIIDENEIFVVIKGQQHIRPLKCAPTDKLGEVRKVIGKLTNTPLTQFKLKLNGNIIFDDTATLAGLGISGFEELEQVIKIEPFAGRKPL